jgi:ABC-type nickel/cobalt efflux system permease component RcnA
MKALNWIAWISSGIGVVLLILAGVSLIEGRAIIVENTINYFHAANTFFLITIALFIFLYRCENKK